MSRSLFLLLFVLLLDDAWSAVSLPKIFGDHMVLQTNSEYGARAFIYGSANPGEAVTVDAPRGPYYTTANEHGRWNVMLDPVGASSKSYNITVSGEEGNPIVFTDVMYGNVILCSGQSNMVFAVNGMFNATAEIAAANHPNIRLFKVALNTSSTPLWDVNGTWELCSPTTIPSFSAVCYLTGRFSMDMHWGDEPLGLIQSAWGGTPIQAWMSPEALAKCPSTSPGGQSQSLEGLDVGGPGDPSVLYNAMINPLVGFSVRAALWYQGEANARESSINSTNAYRCYLTNMITSWRDVWGIGDFAFLFVQLAPYGSSTADAVSYVRQAMLETLPSPGGDIDTTGMAVIIDLGEADHRVHPQNKTEVGRRMALQLLHVALGLQQPEVNFSGPSLVRASAMSNGMVVIEFEYASGMFWNGSHGCVQCCKGASPVQVTSEERTVDNATWFNTTATVQGTKLIVKPMGMAQNSVPKAIRLNFNDFPECVLFNEYLLPASPFLAAVETAKDNVFDVFPVVNELKTPPMGFNSWNYYHCNIDEQAVKSTADAFVATGMAKVGYEFVNIDDCWMVERAPDGTIQADPVRFPSGMKAVTDYVHSKGLKFGLYTAQGSLTCQKRPAAYGHELQDAATYCEWGIDYLKIDGCGGMKHPNRSTSWQLFKQGFDKCQETTGHFTVMSVESCGSLADVCHWYAPSYANLWRTCGDIQATWSSVMSNLDHNNVMAPIALMGHYNDPDMLQVGNVGLSVTESKAHFSLWCIIMAPLLAGTDIVHMSNETLAIMTAPEVVAVNQDPLAKQGVRVSPANATGPEVWARQLHDGSVAVALLNRGEKAMMITATWDEIGLHPDSKATIRDLWERKDVGTATGKYSSNVESHGVFLFKAMPTS
ncbi:uncharacterized protein [Oscarella lobularis]|uniref:uncharacterized protein n=1 Tax=Oscarella lobularis TaxID=121494 RepID=UPI0033133099